MKKNILTLILVTLALAIPAHAQQNDRLDDLRQYAHQFLSRELKLERDQETPFFNAYDQMQQELVEVGEDTRNLERKILKNNDATDLELETAARAMFEQKRKEADIELRYFDQFKTILTPRQLVNLKPAIRKMTRVLLRYSRHNDEQPPQRKNNTSKHK